MSRPYCLSMVGYDAYLTSPAWAEMRRLVLARAGGRCEWCGGPGPFEIHHLTYENLGDEDPADLRALCPACHESADDPSRGETRRIGEYIPAALARIPREDPAKGRTS